jgi:hypothetical protein
MNNSEKLEAHFFPTVFSIAIISASFSFDNILKLYTSPTIKLALHHSLRGFCPLGFKMLRGASLSR